MCCPKGFERVRETPERCRSLQRHPRAFPVWAAVAAGWPHWLLFPPPQSPTLVPLAFKCQSGRQLQPWPLALAPP